MEGSRREEGCRNFWKYRTSGLNKTSLDLEALHILRELGTCNMSSDGAKV